MRIILNGEVKNLPSSLSEMTLGQKISFMSMHGDQLNEMLESIQEMQDGPEKEMELMTWHFEKMFRTFSFFSGVSVKVLKDSEFVDTIASMYYASLQTFVEDEIQLEPKEEYFFNDEMWVIAAPELKQDSKMMFGEFIDAKQIMSDYAKLGKGKWESMLPLCAIYLRRKDEAYEEKFAMEDSERMKLMKDLPLDIAMQVGFFLSSTANIYLSFLRSSGLPKQKLQDRIREHTLNAMVG
jgi:hypothetical protein